MAPFLLMLLDTGFTVFHLLLTTFNVLGWILPRTRRLHRWCVGITAGCWLTIGPLFYGTLGYCPLTDWHWQIKEARGQIALPHSFVTYVLNQIGIFPPPALVDQVVGYTFAVIIAATLFVWWRVRWNAAAIAIAKRECER